jgi:recombination protein RecR
MATPDPLARLIACLGKLPGVGRRSAERMAIRLARDRATLKRDLVAALEDVEASVCECRLCGSLTLRTEDPCGICCDPGRANGQLCVVQDPGDITNLERAGAFRGRYHALMGKLSPMQEQGPAQLRLQRLLERIGSEEIREVILALNSDVEGDATARFLLETLAQKQVKVTRIAFGIPAGSGIGFSDPVTLARAMEGRQDC